MHDDHDHDALEGSGESNNPWPDRVNEAYYDKMGAGFGRKTRDRINWMCAQAQGSSILDIGCSQGIASVLMAREGFNVLGIDISPQAIAYANEERAKEVESVRQRLRFECRELASLQDGAFDTVVMGEVIEHQTNVSQFVRQAARLVAPNGRLVITVPFGLHPWPDHKATVFPRNIAGPLLEEFSFEAFEVADGYIRSVAGRLKSLGAASYERIEILLTATEEGALASQQQFYEVSAECADLKRVLKEADASLREAQDRLVVHDALSKQSSRALVAAEGSRQEATKRIEQLLLEVTTSKVTVDTVQRSIDQLGHDRRADAARIDEITKELGDSRALVTELNEERATLQRAVKELEDALSSRAASNKRLASKVKELQGRNVDLTAKIRLFERSSREHARIAKDLDDARNALEQSEKAQSFLKDGQEYFRTKLSAAYEELVNAQHIRSSHWIKLEAERQRGEQLISLARQLHEENQRYDHSIALALGRAVLGLTSIRGIAGFPRALWRAYNSYKARAAGKLATPELALPVLKYPPIPSKKAVPSFEPPGAGPALVVDEQPLAVAATTADEIKLSIAGWTEDIDPEAKPVMTVLDEFSRSCFSPHAHLLQPRPDNWLGLIDEYEPHFLLVESAWKGNFGTWQYRIANYENPPGMELRDLLKECTARNIPTVFWNKEDPVHFDNFIGAASNFDFVFTTAAEMVPEYQSRTKARVDTLQFAAEDSLHNPIGSAERNGKICYAGSFYQRPEARRDGQLMLLDVASEFDLDIYDRNFHPQGERQSEFAFPEKFARHVRGRLTYDEIGDAYRHYRVFLNMDSVADSSTMFSRRVFELLACGTPIVSTWSRGTEETFGGDLVWHVHDMHEAREAIHALMTDDREWRRRSLAGIRAVMSKHTFRHRYGEILDAIGQGGAGLDSFSNVLVVGEVENQLEADAVVESFRRQLTDHGVKKRLLLLSRHSVELRLGHESVELVVNGTLGLEELISATGGRRSARMVALMSPFAIYGRNYLQDLLHAARYSGAPIVGKPADGREASQYGFGAALDPAAILVNESTCALDRGAIGSLFAAEGLKAAVVGGARMYAADTANFSNGADLFEPAHAEEVLKEIEI